ncbi:glycosyltransferase [Aliifodinibius sp. S!AR15-10]|uniref:glycosyltransferase n=1 Tax=Aliifodinibius sp. S!AR15-10 TaxID=2950437 RepID=UPI00285CB448|nr:glycosyltransferase [Aliifodinibius sp. S!AR15-10]MDR8390586.1 glycosyltransferase [Aliifodinibius sp. S!AR15-10]
MTYSIIIPVYNRPNEIQELLESLTRQTYTRFEVIVVDDGSTERCNDIADHYKNELTLSYFWKENSGPGLTRNFGAEKSSGEFLIFFDSDCIIPDHYMETVNRFLVKNSIDAYGGPDKADQSFTPIQKAINYSMTSFLTTGGIRGGEKSMDRFYPRSFNMGISSDAFARVGGFSKMRFGEDVDLSLRLEENNLISVLIEEAYVYHKRRTNLKSFFKQVFNSGIARYNLTRRHPGSLKLVHLLPSAFVLYLIAAVLALPFFPSLWLPVLVLLLLFVLDSLRSTHNLGVALLSSVTSIIQISGYGSGLIWAVFKHLFLKRNDLSAFKDTFYD